ncbi:hypothetical protein LZ22198_MCBDPFMK_02282 [Levilactobacillus zymae]
MTDAIEITDLTYRKNTKTILEHVNLHLNYSPETPKSPSNT